MKRVLVLDADQRSALAVTRSLGKRAVPVFTAAEQDTALAGCSRYSAGHFSYPAPASKPDAFIDSVRDLAADLAIDILLPMTELTSTLLLANHATLPGTILPFADIDTVTSLNDKSRLMRLAAGIQVPVPHTWYAAHAGELPCALEDLPYPLVLKPGQSWQLLDGTWQRAAVRIAANPAEAREILTGKAFTSHPFMLQSYIPGVGQGIFALYDRGTPIAFFAHRRLREKPPWGGVSVLSESIEVDPALVAHARGILDHVRWHGVAMVEFKVTPAGEPYLMEINTRFWGTLQLAIDAGVDFPYLLYQLACGEHPEPVAAYRTGTRLRWLLGDLDSLYLTLRERRYSGWEKCRAMLRFCTPSIKKTRYETWRWSDTGPFRHELRNYIRALRN